MRLYFISLAIAVLFCMPYLALYYGLDHPVSGVVMLPVTGIHLVANTVHETGHAIGRWAFGYPAWPKLDLQFGGGFTDYGERSIPLLCLVWALLAASIAAARVRGRRRLAVVLYTVTMIHAIIAFQPLHEVVILYMGHALEAVAACACVCMAARSAGKLHPFWRGALSVAGLYVFLKNMLLCLGLALSHGQRVSYAALQAERGAGDYSRIAALTNWDVEVAAGVMLAFVLSLLAASTVYTRRRAEGRKSPDQRLLMEARRLLSGAYPRRLFILSAGLAALSLVSYGFYQFNADLPLWLTVLLLPLSEALHYMTVLVHEPGHAVTHWVFAAPAFPLIDAFEGGGVTYSFGKSKALLAGIYGMLILGCVLAARRGKWKAAGGLCALGGLHALFLMQEWEAPLTAFMGHGAEAVAGGWLVLRALDRHAPHSLPERYVSMIFGLHLWGRVALLALALNLDPVRRMSYAAQKGRPGSADLDMAARAAGVPVETAAVILGLFLAACISATLAVLHRRGTFGGK